MLGLVGLVGLVGSLGRVWGWSGLMFLFLNSIQGVFGFGGGVMISFKSEWDL